MNNRYNYVPPKNDIQAISVYDWGANYLFKTDQEYLDLNTCKLLCEDIFRGFKVPLKKIPEILPASERDDMSAYSWWSNKITILDEMRYRPLILHEITHALMHHFHPKKPTHGAHFMGIFMILLNKYCKIPMDELIRTVELNSIDYKFSRHFRKGYRIQRSLTNSVKHGVIKLPLTKLSGIRVREPNPKGGYKLTYHYDW